MIKEEQFKSDVFWNFISIIFLGVSGLGLNIIIGYVYSAAYLGIFNQALAFYIVFSQIGTLGVNLFTLKKLSEPNLKNNEISNVLSTSLVLVSLSSALFTAILYFLSPMFSLLMESEQLKTALIWISPGLFFFCINKVFFAALNGLHQMKAFSIFTSLRYINLIIGLGIALGLKFEGEKLSYVFSFSEIIVFLGFLFHFRKQFTLPFKNFILNSKSQFNFGIRSMMGGTLLDLNSRVDVLMIGFLMSDTSTGIYSFASMIAEGILQLLVVLQNNYNPYLTKLLHNKDYLKLLDHFRDGRKTIYKYALFLLPVILVGYPIGLAIVTNKPEFENSIIPFTILALGLFGASGYYPFHNILMLGGKPGAQTIFILLMAITNIILNAIFIPIFGIAGAALGSAMALVSGNFYLILLTNKFLNFRLN